MLDHVWIPENQVMTAPRFHASSAALTLLLFLGAGAPIGAQIHKGDYDDVDPWAGVAPRATGADSSVVARFLETLSVADPVVCQFVVHSIGNNWAATTERTKLETWRLRFAPYPHLVPRRTFRHPTSLQPLGRADSLTVDTNQETSCSES